MLMMLALQFPQLLWAQRRGNETVGLKGLPADADDARSAVR